MKPTATIVIAGVLFCLPFSPALRAMDPEKPCADRAAIERVYHQHRTGTEPPFEEAMPPALLARLVSEDGKKEALLARAYGATITDAMVNAEVERINATTRAPEMLAEIKAALGNDPVRFARAMARPLVVERALRARFENDDALHAPQRRAAEQARARWIAKETVDETHDVTWQLTPQPALEHAELEKRNPPAATAPVKSAANSGSYSVEATTQLAQVLSSHEPGARAKDENRYFEDLAPRLQDILRAQLRRPGDVSAVIETPSAFLLFQVKAKTDTTLTASNLTIPKRSYEEWLALQPD